MTNFPSPELTQETIKATTSYIDTPEWIEKLSAWGKGFADVICSTILDLIRKGAGPRAIAAKVRQYAESMPKHASETLMRTLQNKAYQQAARETEKLNGRFIRGRIRIATLDDRTCLTCVALSGQKLEDGEDVDDHYRGRCSVFYQVLGGPDFPSQMQADSTPGNRKFVPWQTGEEWFASLSPERQQQQASFKATPAKYKAYLDGHPLSEFVGEHTDPVFGRMTIEESLKGVFGEEKAKTYYVNQPGKYNNGQPYYRFTHSDKNPMSKWGTAMFADDVEKVTGVHNYGTNAWEFKPGKTGKILDESKFRPIISKELERLRNSENPPYELEALQKRLKSGDYTMKQFVDSFFPSDVVNSAEAYDDDDMMTLLGKIIDEKGIDAIITPDGAIVFNRDLIKRANKFDWGNESVKKQEQDPKKVESAEGRKKYDEFISRMKGKYDDIYQDMTDAEIDEMEKLERGLKK
jgi:hypothetical protein